MKHVERPPKSVRLRFKNPKYDRIVRVNTESIARKMGFDEDRVFDISLAVEEAYANAIEHSGRPASDLELEILYLLFADRLEVSIQDTGCGFDQKQVPMDLDFHQITGARGRGLALIRTLSDQVEILSAPGAGTLIRMVKRLTICEAKPILADEDSLAVGQSVAEPADRRELANLSPACLSESTPTEQNVQVRNAKGAKPHPTKRKKRTRTRENL
jgi:anti-sigma regulatory factor (Ser/Thr protein kinase)